MASESDAYFAREGDKEVANMTEEEINGSEKSSSPSERERPQILDEAEQSRLVEARRAAAGQTRLWGQEVIVSEHVKQMLSKDGEMFWSQEGPFVFAECVECHSAHVNTEQCQKLGEAMCPNCFTMAQLMLFEIAGMGE